MHEAPERATTVLAFVWLVRIVLQLSAGLSPVLDAVSIAIWAMSDVSSQALPPV